MVEQSLFIIIITSTCTLFCITLPKNVQNMPSLTWNSRFSSSHIHDGVFAFCLYCYSMYTFDKIYSCVKGNDFPQFVFQNIAPTPE